MAGFVKAARRGEIPEGGAKVVEAGGRTIAIFNAGGSFHAIDNSCRHLGGPLGAGEVYGTRVICPWHGWEFDFTTGANVDDPAMRVSCFAVRLEGDDVLVEV
ncbi:MAG: Rieske 2Fe-2S domain-containing protein [Candidatus Binataceae bacterium]|nr:Rieske 2Fe-2S domain-containing protein [Candidatus Binataceae bacterium]